MKNLGEILTSQKQPKAAKSGHQATRKKRRKNPTTGFRSSICNAVPLMHSSLAYYVRLFSFPLLIWWIPLLYL
jgi:hypothetical protein